MIAYTIKPIDIIKILITKQDASECISACEEIISALYNLKEPIEEKFQEHLSYEKKNQIILLCKQNNVSLTDYNQVQDFLEFFKQTLQALPIISLKLAFDPTENNLYTISNWFITKLNRFILLDITYDKALVGSAIITYNGKYKDYSLRKKLKQQHSYPLPL